MLVALAPEAPLELRRLHPRAVLGLVPEVALEVGLQRAARRRAAARPRARSRRAPRPAPAGPPGARPASAPRSRSPSFNRRSVVSSTAWAREPRRIASGSGVTRAGCSSASTSHRTPQAANVSSCRAPSVRRASSCASTGSLTGAGSGGGSGSLRAAAWARWSSRGVGASRGDQVTSASSRRPRCSHSSSVNSARTSSRNGDATSGSPSSSDDRQDRNSTSCGRETHA